MARKRAISNPLALAVLALLVERPMHPYEMGSTLRHRHKEDSIKLNYGSLYTVVESLQRVGFIEARETVRETRRPQRTVFGLTVAGRAELDEWLGELLSTPRKEFHDFEAALALMPVFPPAEATALLRRRMGLLDEELEAHRVATEQALAAGLDPVHLVEDDYRAALLSAERTWVARLLERIHDPAFGGDWRAFHEPGDGAMR